MRKLLVLEFLTLDGVMQAPGGPKEDPSGGFEFGGWTAPYFDDFAGKMMAGQMQEPFSLLLGRKTFDIFASYWPQHTDQWPGINEATKYVASHTHTSSDWQNVVFLQDDIAKEIQKIKAEKGPHIQVYGSGNLVQTLLKHDLVDEFWLKIFPITLGKGKRLFEEGTLPAAFTLTDSKISPSGVIFANYKRAGKVKTGSVG
jgi:dihydrofolate reductase